MTRESLIPLLASLSLLLAIACPVSAENSASPRNVLVIAIDDLNDWIGCLGGHPDAITPHMDALASRGRLFTNAHCSVPVCSPSRVSTISGVGPITHGSYELGPRYQDLPALDDVPTLPGWFREHGFLTIAGGKVLHHGFGGRLAEDIERNLDRELESGRKKGGPRPAERMNWDLPVWDWGPYPADDAAMFDYQLAEAAAGVLREKHERPFFLTVGLFRPHVPMFVPPKWFDLYDPDTLTLPDTDPGVMADIPPNFQYKMGVAPTLAEVREAGGEEKWRSMVRAYLASVSFVDHCVGRIVEGLDSGPNADDTLLVLWSDHGFHLGEKQHIAKRTLWEESTRVPLLFAGPGIEPGACSEAVSLLDLYPTLVNRLAVPTHPHLEGVDLAPQLDDPETPREEPALTSSYFGNHAVRTRDWRYIRYADGAEELYDHRVDPAERNNLAGDPEHDEIREKLAASLPENAAPEVKPEKTREQVRAGVAGRR